MRIIIFKTANNFEVRTKVKQNAHAFSHSHVVKNDVKLAVVLYTIYCHLLAQLHASCKYGQVCAIANTWHFMKLVLYVHMVWRM